jgi:hypothetical protein
MKPFVAQRVRSFVAIMAGGTHQRRAGERSSECGADVSPRAQEQPATEGKDQPEHDDDKKAANRTHCSPLRSRPGPGCGDKVFAVCRAANLLTVAGNAMLVSKGYTVERGESVGGWLYRVAYSAHLNPFCKRPRVMPPWLELRAGHFVLQRIDEAVRGSGRQM